MSSTSEETQLAAASTEPARPRTSRFNGSLRRVVAAFAFLLVGIVLFDVAPTTEIAWVCAILLLTVYLFVSELVGVDVAAISVMVLLGLTSQLAPLIGIEQGSP